MDNNKLISLVVCVLLSVLSISRVAHTQKYRTIALSTGNITGYPTIASNDGSSVKMYAYKRIPYAMPPTGARRFLPPSPPANWNETLNINITDDIEVPACPQAAVTGLNTSEDCLYINVYTPETIPENTTLPVMVWIHGGAFKSGNSDTWKPDFLVNKGVIFVAFNYRLGALGFLNLNMSHVPGNVGLLDQRLALQWVQKEIELFGGDKNKVTIFGQSAGSASVAFHYISPASQGLFARAICESGSALSDRHFLKEGYLDRAKTFAQKLNSLDENGQPDLTSLQLVDLTTIIGNQELDLSEEYLAPGNDISFPPTIDSSSATPVLPDTPANLLANLTKSNTTRVPLLLGVNKDEGTTFVKNTTNYTALHSNLIYFIPSEIRLKQSDNENKKRAELIFKEYFNVTEPSVTNLDGYIKLFGDKAFKVPTAKFAKQIARFGNVYVYHFEYSGFLSSTTTTPDLSKRIGHGDELKYLFYSNQTINDTLQDTKILRKMVELWTNFATSGNPTSQNTTTDTTLGTLNWTPTGTNTSYLIIAQNSTMSDNFLDTEIKFWSSIDAAATQSFGYKITYSVLLLLGTFVVKMLF